MEMFFCKRTKRFTVIVTVSMTDNMREWGLRCFQFDLIVSNTVRWKKKLLYFALFPTHENIFNYLLCIHIGRFPVLTSGS